MNPFWFVYNPLTSSLFNIVFGIFLVVGLGLVILNLVRLATSHQRLGPAIGLVIGLVVTGISARWDVILPIISDAMGGVMQYVTIYLWMLINQWLTQQTATLATAVLVL